MFDVLYFQVKLMTHVVCLCTMDSSVGNLYETLVTT